MPDFGQAAHYHCCCQSTPGHCESSTTLSCPGYIDECFERRPNIWEVVKAQTTRTACSGGMLGVEFFFLLLLLVANLQPPGVPGGIKERIPLQAKNHGLLKNTNLNLRDFFPDPFLVRSAPRTNHASSWWSPLRNHTWQRWMQGTLRKRDNLRFERIPLNGFYDLRHKEHSRNFTDYAYYLHLYNST